VSSVVAGLRQLNPEVVIELVGRDASVAAARASQLGAQSMSGVIPDLFVNATPATGFPVSIENVLSKVALHYDLPVRPVEHSFPGRPEIISGEEMFKWQFMEQFRIYTGREVSEQQFTVAATAGGF
jgi:shikimate 5-dehydrogenase